VENRNISELVAEADKKVAAGDFSAMMNYYIKLMFSPACHGDFRDIAMNEQLGMKPMEDQELEDYVREMIKEKQ
jgi:hypothetical protein